MQRTSMPRRREYPGGDVDNNGSRRPHRDWRAPERGRYPNQGVRPPDQGGYPDGGPLEMEDPLEEDTLEEDLLMEMEDSLEMEDLLVMEDPLDLLVDKDHQPSGTTWTSKAYNSTNSPGDTRYICPRKYV